MSILVSTFQITGCILYCGGEAYDGFKHVPLVSSINQDEYYFNNQFSVQRNLSPISRG